MATYCAVVKYPLDANLSIKKRELLEGLGMIAMELVAEHDFTIDEIQEAFDIALGEAELEFQMKRLRCEDSEQ